MRGCRWSSGHCRRSREMRVPPAGFLGGGVTPMAATRPEPTFAHHKQSGANAPATCRSALPARKGVLTYEANQNTSPSAAGLN